MNTVEIEEMDQPTLEKFIGLVHKLTGITLNANKKTLLQGRVRLRLRKLGLSTYTEYADYLGKRADELQNFINAVTTNETLFFRTQRVWDYFQTEFLPEYVAKHPNKLLRIWSAAASSGEEAYTIAICCEEFHQKHPTFTYQIIGTDISTEVLAVAQKGEYRPRSIEAFRSANKALFDKYLTPSGENFRVSDALRSKVHFDSHNLFQPLRRGSEFDIVFLRNVLIYFEQPDQEKVLSNVSKALAEKGILIIGESESLSRLKSPFQYKAPLVYENVRT